MFERTDDFRSFPLFCIHFYYYYYYFYSSYIKTGFATTLHTLFEKYIVCGNVHTSCGSSEQSDIVQTKFG